MRLPEAPDASARSFRMANFTGLSREIGRELRWPVTGMATWASCKPCNPHWYTKMAYRTWD
eukprot:75475-Chlamydomonas_euryale.AAC.4